MTRTLVALAMAVAFLGSAASAQQMDGRDCDLAFKKHQQHRQNNTCREKAGPETGGSVSQTPEARQPDGTPGK